MLSLAMSEVPETGPEMADAKAGGGGSHPDVGGPMRSQAPSPDPVIGAGLTLLGIFIMGVAGAAGAHYAFNLGTLVACIGAVVFVLFVALSALKQRSKATANRG